MRYARRCSATIACVWLATLSLPSKGIADQLQGDCGGLHGEMIASGVARGTLAKATQDTKDQTAAGVLWDMTDIHLVDKTDLFPLVDGNIMFIQYKITANSSDGQTVKLRLVKTFPPSGMKNEKGDTYYQAENAGSIKLTGNSWTGNTYWTFTNQYPFEMVEGKWTFRIYSQECLLLEKSFMAYKPKK